MRIYIETYGCQMNKLDSELVEGEFAAAGFDISDSDEDADVILVNTCSVRAHAEDRVYSRLGRFKFKCRNNPSLIIGVIGCMAEKDAKKILNKIPHVSLVAGTRHLDDLPALVQRAAGGERVIATGEKTLRFSKRNAGNRRRNFQAYVSIMRGCDNYCAYCVVPYVRGREKSRLSDEIVDECRRLVDDGVVEITLLGQNVNSYGKGLAEKITFPDLLERVDAIEGLRRLRFVTSHPKDCSDELLEAMRDLPSVCGQLHLPAQSGSTKILGAMNRGYTAEEYRERIAKAREFVPGIRVMSDFIVGFPGENEEDAAATESLVRDARFLNCFIFSYSVRPGTAAAKLSDDVPPELKSERHQRLLALQKEISTESNAAAHGSAVEVLVEGRSHRDERRLTGRTRGSEIVVFECEKDLTGRFVEVKIIDSTALTLFGETIHSSA
ncbi:MAG: tRNA (N6-isopentenyl adenosine(37)-C2)-methylthiotransferase MiaB [Planctomycetota bacterium]|jgi:tRNA-2-methylthio-N6-dimethylallyladenosine synthase